MGKSYRYNEYEQEFYNDVRDKKRTATGVYHRASRRGYVGAVKTQSDFLTAKEKKKLNGIVKVYNMYDKYSDVNNLPKKREFMQMSKENPTELKKILEVARKHNNTAAIFKAVGISNGTLYNVYDKVGIAYNKGRRCKNTEIKNEAVNKDNISLQESSVSSTDNIDLNSNEIKILKERLDLIENGVSSLVKEKSICENKEFSLSINIESDRQHIEDRIIALSSILLDNVKYKFTLNIEEIKEVVVHG